MSEAATRNVSAPGPAANPAPALPLFFNRVVGVNPALHPELRLDRSTGYGFAAKAQSVPLGLSEMEVAAQHYPILFTGGDQPMPVALLGLRENSNLFVDAQGNWAADSYVPAYVRAFPFIFVEDPATKTLFVGMEPDARALTTGQGERLFEDGRPTTLLNDSIAFCTAYREAVLAAGVFARALQTALLLEEEEATINFTSGGLARIRGFKLLKQERLAELDDNTYLEWRRMGWIAAIYAHLYSIGRWGRLIERAASL
jgi:hypothetical protein